MKAEEASAPEANGLRVAILGLLAIRPMTGYDVRRAYERSLQRVWYARIGQVYPTLRRMEREGLLRSTVEVQTDKPNRRVYELSPTGWAQLRGWLAQPADLPRMHHELIHRVFLMNHMEPDLRQRFVRDYATRCQQWADDLESIAAKMQVALDGPYADSVHFQMLSLRHLTRLAHAEAAGAAELARAVRSTSAAAGRKGLHGRPAIIGDLALQ
ncbi:MAG: PadR family transcriptional regulator [Acidimicrobiales bacterium]